MNSLAIGIPSHRRPSVAVAAITLVSWYTRRDPLRVAFKRAKSQSVFCLLCRSARTELEYNWRQRNSRFALKIDVIQIIQAD